MRRLAILALLAVAAFAVAGEEELPPSVTWVKANARPFATVLAGSGLDDLDFLKETIGDARVVGLGEATHGTREHFQMKHRLLEHLATEMGFNVFAIEASMPESYRVDRYVTGGVGDPAELIGGMYFWTWNTEEVLEMVKWMRAFNEREAAAKSGRHVRFAGFDMQAPEHPKAIVRGFVKKHDLEFLPELDARWKAASESTGRRGGGFGVTNAFLPVESVRGRKVRFSGFIRTQDIQDGWAGLWLRVDTESEPNKWLDNMHDRGPKGTTDWKAWAVDVEVPQDASCVNFGVLLVGSGSAWFDALALEVDGKRTELLADPSFEGSELGPFVPEYSRADELHTVDETAKEGKRSLLMRREVRPAAAGSGAASARTVEAHLGAARERYVAAGASPTDVDWAIQNAHLVVQAVEMHAADDSGAARDASMAENVRWILDQDANAKVVLWAHNYHVSSMAPWMGSHLKTALGPKYVNFGFMAGGGTYYAMGEDTEGAAQHVHRLQPPLEGSTEWIFRKTGMPRAILDLRGADRAAPGAAWAFAKTKFGGTVGAGRMDERFSEIDPHEAFDLLLYVDQTSAARQLKTPPADGPPND